MQYQAFAAFCDDLGQCRLERGVIGNPELRHSLHPGHGKLFEQAVQRVAL